MSTSQSVPIAISTAVAGSPPAPKHPVAFIFHFAFKVAAMVFYMLCESFNKNQFVLNFVVCIVLLAMDFWTVKNVTGRLLVGLRWWNEGNGESGDAWRFESLMEVCRLSLAAGQQVAVLSLGEQHMAAAAAVLGNSSQQKSSKPY
eukprot:GHUV01037999.1.p1 GENE.GHUV01037999.1~~GHUV01037999.1.p1  ORF type:complete len:145 (+),score=34.70 GHUV01037999.1:354-788(+)